MMTKSEKNTVNIKVMVESQLSGDKGFANGKKLRRLGIEEFSNQLSGNIAEKVARQLSDPRRKKRADRSKS
ncbi:MAG: hypothetical protein JKY12_08305 [Sneathiella sp.]|nr:hypothetical protein [Sneathiella sp.]